MGGDAKVTKCHACLNGELESFLSLHDQPLGNGFLKPGARDHAFPMCIAVCNACWTVQVKNPPTEAETRDLYEGFAYVPTGFTLAAHYAAMGKELAISLPEGARVLDIGSNDGTLLIAMLAARPDLKVQGIEPAAQLAKIAVERGVPTMVGFFDASTAAELAKNGPYDLVLCTQVLQHIPDTLGTFRLVKSLLSPNGVFFVEGRYILDTLKEGAFDTFYQELRYEFGLLSLRNLTRAVGLSIFDAERIPAYGGSLRVWAKDNDVGTTIRMQDRLEEERGWSLNEFTVYQAFGDVAMEKAQRVRDLMKTLKGRTAAYGCSSTGTTLLNFCGLDKTVIDYAVDDNPLKVGLLIPGVGIPIRAPAVLKEDPVENVLVLPWRLESDIIGKLRVLGFNGNIVVPLSEPHIIKGVPCAVP